MTYDERVARQEMYMAQSRKDAARGKVDTAQGSVGNSRHITRDEWGYMPTSQVAQMHGARGEIPGGHRNKQGERWDAFKSSVAEHGVKEPIFITVDHDKQPQLSEGNHRRDAAVELGHTHVPVNVRYFGHSEQQHGGSLFHDRRES